jgi:tetratricopeptide (TPR) repeat protein
MKRKLGTLFLIIAFLVFQGCLGSTSPSGKQRLIPLKEANLEAVFEQNEGLEIMPEDAKELRDFYRRGVQQKAKAEKLFQDKAYPEALKLYRSSNDSFFTLLRYISEDSAEYTLFEDTHILFFPNLLMADNELKMGLIHQAMGREDPARRCWKRGLTSVQKSLKAEPTEWGLSLQEKLISMCPSKNN